MKVHLHGALVDEADARISPFDRGLLLGDAVFETMRAYGGRCFALDEHLARLATSCATTRLPMPDDLPRRIDEVLRANALAEAAVRVTLTRGPGGRGASPRGAGPPTVLVTATAVHVPPEVYERGVRLVTARWPRLASPHPAMKSTNYVANVVARIEAEEEGADDALFLDVEGFVVEATQANLFAVFGDRLATPALSSGCLPGVTRARLLALASKAGLRPEERPLAREELAEADEVFLSASVTEVAPVVALDGVVLGGGRPGDATRRLHALYREHARANAK